MDLSFLTTLNSESTLPLVFGGLTLVCLALVSLVAVMAKQYFNQSKHYYNHTNDVIQRNTAAWVENAKSNQKLADVIDKWHSKK